MFVQVNHRFTTEKGNKVEVFVAKSVDHNGTFSGFSRNSQSKEAFAVVNGKQRFQVNPGRTFEAHSVVRRAGF